MAARPFRAKLRMANKRFQAILKRAGRPDQDFPFETREAAERLAVGHLQKWGLDADAEVWERDAKEKRKIWP